MADKPVILVVDDDEDIRSLIESLLVCDGYEVETAVDGLEACRKVENAKFDVILSDIDMPRMDGLAFLKAVRGFDTDVPVLFLTGHPSLNAAINAIEYGAHRFLLKPIDAPLLRAELKKACQMSRIACAKSAALRLVGANLEQVGDRFGLETRFVRAMDTLWMAFQPIVRWSTKTVYAYEALMRTNESSLMSPPDFLSAAERLDRVHELSRCIRRTIVEAASDRPDDCRLFVNLHPNDLLDDELFNEDNPFSSLSRFCTLEMTERLPLDGIHDVRKRTRLLRSLGFQLAVDDLGAGYAGLTSFSLLEPEVVKLDLALIRSIHQDPRRETLVQSIVDACGALDIDVICEGVEQPEEVEVLSGMGCDLFQGYHFAKPGPGFIDLQIQ